MYKEFANIYDDLIYSDFDYEKLFSFLEVVLEKYKVKYENYLDNGCGTGNVTKFLNEKFNRGIASDISMEMVEIASEKFTNSKKAPQFMVMSAEDVLITDGFNLIISVMDLPNYLGYKKFRLYLENSYISLRDGGVLIFDISSKHKLNNDFGNETYIFDDENYFYVWKNTKSKAGLKNPYINIEIDFFKKISGIKDKNNKETIEYNSSYNNLYEKFYEEQRMYILDKKEVDKIIKETGFIIESVTNNYSFDNIDSKTKRITYVLRRRNNG